MNITTSNAYQGAKPESFQASSERTSQEELGSPLGASASDKEFIIVGPVTNSSRRSRSVDIGSLSNESSSVINSPVATSKRSNRNFQDHLHAWYDQNFTREEDTPEAVLLTQEIHDLQSRLQQVMMENEEVTQAFRRQDAVVTAALANTSQVLADCRDFKFV